MEISQPGEYRVMEDIQGHLIINASDVKLEGQGYTVFGYVHVKDCNQNVSITNLNVEINDVDDCFKDETDKLCMVYAYRCNNLELTNINLQSDVLDIDPLHDIINSSNVTIDGRLIDTN